MDASRLLDAVTLPVTGLFTLDVRDGGRVVERVRERNMVVTGARTILAGLLGGARTGPGVANIGFGASMTPPDFGNTALVLPYIRPLDGVTYGPASVVFAFSLPGAEANGLSIGEFGLFAADGVMFARKTRTYAVIPKIPTLSLTGTWTIQF